MRIKKQIRGFLGGVFFGIAILFAADWLLSGLWTILTKQCPVVIAWIRGYNWQPLYLFFKYNWKWLALCGIGTVAGHTQGKITGRLEEVERKLSEEENEKIAYKEKTV